MWLRQPVGEGTVNEVLCKWEVVRATRIMRKRIAAKERRVHSAAKPQPQRDYLQISQITQIFRVGSGAGSAQD